MDALGERDALLSRRCGQLWPYQPLLGAVQLSADADVLDIGAGNGALLTLLRERGAAGRLVGLDPRAGPDVQLGRAEALPFPDGHFGAVFMVRSLLHSADPGRALAEARRVLRPDGTLIVAVQGAAHLAAFWSRYGPPSPGADALTARQLAGWAFERLDTRLPVALSPQDAATLARTYALPPPGGRDTLTDHLHLAVFKHRK
ncbi:methyltransferase [Deinococcus irradiatisoli]|uniref:Methyltransferase n=1 Tax=Deinococcus irradiatisoli TaxID=2202254 RepID=A0A2Z3JSP1_9DEIO|nr:class I SAM-dependent methyltransferase [Deinococcus irradiatisoli]AWN23724.1 methyltransferase [Deinococcus irradiatisoli]